MSNITKAVAALSVVAGLGVAALPLSSFAATSWVDITAIVDNTIGISTSTDEVTVSVTADGPVVTKGVDVTVTTNSTTGYTLGIMDSDTNTALVKTNDNGVADGTIPAGQPAKGTAAWGYQGGTKTNWTPVTTSNVIFVTTSSSTLNGSETTPVTFGVSAASNTAEGTYKGGVIFTATVK